MLWTGEVIPKFSQTYTFTATTAGGDMLYIRPHDSSTWTTLVNDWTVHTATADTASYALTAGQTYDIELEYRQPTVGAAAECKLHWSSPSTPDEAIEAATGVGINFISGDGAFANMVDGTAPDTWNVPKNNWSEIVPTDSNHWPEGDAELLLGNGDASTVTGTSYLIQFNGTAVVSNWPQNVEFWVGSTDYGSSLPAGDGYNSVTNTTTTTMVLLPNQNAGFYLMFTNTSRDGNVSNPEHNGITNLYVMQPTTEGGSTDPQPGTLFTPAGLDLAAQYTTLRLMDFTKTNGNLSSNWSDRTVPGDNFWSGWTLTGGSGVTTGDDSPGDNGVPWELCVALANETGKDLYINIPALASIEYIDNLADLFAYGSNGVTPYTGPQANPVWAPLNSNLKVYIEFSNEIWNSMFTQSGSKGDGWANQLSQRAVYDYLTNDQNDSLYPGGGATPTTTGRLSPRSTSPAATRPPSWPPTPPIPLSTIILRRRTSPTPPPSTAIPSSRAGRPSAWSRSAPPSRPCLAIRAYMPRPRRAACDRSSSGNTAATGPANWANCRRCSLRSTRSTTTSTAAAAAGMTTTISTTGSTTRSLPTAISRPRRSAATSRIPAGASFTFTGAAGMAANGSSLGNPTAPTEGPTNAPAGSTQTAYMQPGASISQSVDFSGGWGDITLFATQTSSSYNYGLTISIDGGAALQLCEGGAGYSGSTTSTSQWGWERTTAFSVTAGYHTVTFTNTSSSGGATVFIDDLGIQTVNGIIEGVAATFKNNTLDLMSDVALCQQWGLSDVGYEGGFDFNQCLGLDDSNGYDDMGEKDYSGDVPNVAMEANLDPRAVAVVMGTLDQFYNAGGTLPIVYESTGNINSSSVAVPTYYNYDTPKQQAAATVETSLPPTGTLPANWSSTFFGGTSLGSPPGNSAFDGTTTTLRGTGGQVDYGGNSALADLTNVSGDTTLIAKMVSTQVGGSGSSRAGIILADSSNGASTTPAVELGVYGYGSSSYNSGNGIIELTAQFSSGSQNDSLATVNVATPYMVQSGNNAAPDEIHNSPVWLKLVETGSGSSTVFTGYYSMNGLSWTEVGATTAGLVSFPHSTNVAGLVSTSITRFTNVSVSPLLFTTPPTASPATVTGTTCRCPPKARARRGIPGSYTPGRPRWCHPAKPSPPLVPMAATPPRTPQLLFTRSAPTFSLRP